MERGSPEDALQLDPRVGVLAGVHQGGGQEVAGAEVGRLEGQHPAERVGGLVPRLLFVMDGAELHPDPRVVGRHVRQRLELLLGLLVLAEADQEVAQPLHEARVVGVHLDGAPVHLDGLVRLAPGLVDVAEGGPRGVVIGIQLDGPLELADRVVPRLGLDGEPAQEEVRLRQVRADRDEPEQHPSGLVVGPLLHEVARQGEVAVGGPGVERDDLLQLGLGLAPALLPAVELGQREVDARVVGRQGRRLEPRLDGFLGRVGLGEPEGQLGPEGGRGRVPLDRLFELCDGFLQPAGLGVELSGRVMEVGLGGGVALSGARDGRPRGVGLGGRSRRRAGAAREAEEDQEDERDHDVASVKWSALMLPAP